MLSSFIKIMGFIVSLFLLASAASGAEIKADTYDIYIGDVNGDGGSDYYFQQKPVLVILHGDIATPIYAKMPNSFVVYRNGADYSTPQLLTLTDAQLSQKLTAGSLRLASSPTDFSIWNSGAPGESYIFLRGADNAAPALLLKSSVIASLPIYQKSYSVANYAGISDRNVPLRIQDINTDGLMDIVLGSYNSSAGEIAYLADGNGVPSTAFPVTAANTLPSVLLNTQEGISYHVGTVGGEFRVDESGAATYTIPIQVPQGTAGVTPQVSLGYSSGAGVGILGKGWSLNAFSSISRCRQTLSQDNAAKPINWSSDDRFCLDGQRLILVSGSYGAANSTYKTEMDSFATITAVGGVSDGSGYFKSVAKDGSTTFFGLTNNSKFYNSTAGLSTTLTWAQSRFQDNVGNGIDYVYEGDSTTGQRLKNIHYAYVPQSSTAQTVVTFNYEDRPDISSSYVAGYEFKQTQRLYQILVQNNSAELRRYNLSYLDSAGTETSYGNKISRLERIRECNGAGNCLKPTTFKWGGGSQLNLSQVGNSITFTNTSSGKYILSHFFASLTGNGKQDLVYLMFESGTSSSAQLSVRVKYADTSSSSVISFSSKDTNKFRIANLDYNADGRQDLAVYDNTKWYIYISTPQPNGTWTVDSSSIRIDTGLTEIDTSFIDVNSDGLADAVTAIGARLLVRNGESIGSSKAYSFESSIRSFSWGTSINYPEAESQPMPGTCSNINYKQKLTPTKAADFNGDGVVDFIGDYIKQGTCWVSGAPTQQAISIPSTYALVVSGNTVRKYGNSSRLTGGNITPIDINGDGLSDLTYRISNDIYYMINNGAGFNAATVWVTLPSGAAAPQFLDVNGDGWLDIAWANRTTGKLYTRLWGKTTDDVIQNTISTGQNDAHFLMDISGDGILDYLSITSTALSGYLGTVSNSSISLPADKLHTNIYSIDNGLGNITKITYGSLSNSGRYQTTDLNLTVTTETGSTGCQEKGYPCAPTYTTTTTNAGDFYSRLNGGWVLPDGSVTLVSGNATKGNPVLEVNGATPVVVTVESSAPSAGATANNVSTTSMSKVDYYYSEAKLQAAGRGFLGFNTLKTIDAQTGITTVTTYRQDFPFIGSPLSTIVYKSNAKDAVVLSKAINTWDFSQGTGTDNTKYFQTKLKKVEEFSYDYNDGAQLQAITTDNAFDGYGNLTSSTVATTGKKVDGSATTFTKQTTNSYGTTPEYKQFGRLTSATVTTTRDSEPSSSRSSSFTYYGAGDSKGAEYLLKTETVSAGSLATTTTTYEYDAFGNKNKITTTASDTSQARNVVQNFGTNGRYLQSSTNDLNQSSVINERDNYGNVKAATDINNLQSQIFYDAMGSEYLRKDATGAWSRVDSNFCEAVSCPDGAKYRVRKQVAGGGESYEYFDVLGRVIRSSKVGFDGNLIHIDTEYDNLNRVKRQSVPFSGSAAEYWTENTYDHLGRIVEVKAPDGSKSTSTYAGNKTTVTNALNQTREEYRNGLGQLAKVKDHLGGTVEYEYDLYGNLTKAKTTANGTAITVQMCYDTLGRKVAMHDPDKGGFVGNANLTCAQVIGASPKKTGWWYYSYNAFGELIEQTDPKNQRIKNYYDATGRMIGRTDYLASGAIESFSQWFYEGGLGGTHNPVVQGKLTATVMNTAAGLTTSQVENFIQTKTASCNENSSSCDKTLFDFDVFGQPITTSRYYPGSNTAYTARTKYDTFGRVSFQYDALDRVIKDTSGKLLDSAVQTHYNNYGYPYKTTDVATGKTLQLTQETNVLGQITRELRGNGLVSVNTYDVRTGLLNNQKTLNSLNLSTVQNNFYEWDSVGNLKYRQNLSGKPGTPVANNSSVSTYAQAESFCYDGLNRLIKTNASTTSTSACSSLTLANQDVRYDGHGNITYKKGVGDYTYASSTVAGPHAVTTAGSSSYTYDANGNNVSGDGRNLQYTSYDMVKSISKAGKTTQFKYGIDRARWQRIDATATTTYLGNVERIQIGSVIEWKRNIAGTILTYKTDANNQLQATDKRYVYTDHLGSVDLITDANGEVGGQFSKVSHAMSFDAWGTRKNTAQWNDASFTLALSSLTVSGFLEPITRRGYTGHEMVDDMGIIHMNGRIYDAKLARFLQADPFIQAATNTQSYNRYSYVLNNPLNAIDPSGFFFSDLKKAWNKVRPFVGAIVATVLTVFAPAGAGVWYATFVGAAAGAAGAAANGGNILRGAFTGAISAAAFYGVGSAFSEANCSTCYGGIGVGRGLTTAAQVSKVFAHAMVGGVMSVLQGGKFGNGFASAGVTQAFAGKIDAIGGKGSSSYFDAGSRAARVVAAAVVGGTASILSGGKFANGAITGAFSRAFNDEAHQNKLEKEQYEKQRVIAYSKAGVQGVGGVVTVVAGGAATGLGIAACLIAEPCGVLLVIGGVGTMALGAVSVHDSINDIQNLNNGTNYLPFAERMGEAYGGESGRLAGEIVQTTIDSVLLTKSAANLSASLATGKTVNYVELIDSANTLHSLMSKD
ncbi:MAG TPA: FG-GAP-like repeat-containing protein [Cellvibrio sp.]|nr:FG-GAP-like repeat-containing protein [Cellvibrio sp.]